MSNQNNITQSDERSEEKISEKKGKWINSNPFDLTSELVFVEDKTQWMTNVVAVVTSSKQAIMYL